MKVFRFLATLAMVFMIGSGSRVIAQQTSSHDSGDLAATDYEFRVCAPCHPFQVTEFSSSTVQPLDDQGRHLPINQCKLQYLPIPADRCGFSAGNIDHRFVETEAESHIQEIDLSPMRLDCVESGCEFEYARSARKYQAQAVEQQQAAEPVNHSTLTRDEVKRIIASVFTKELDVNQILEAQFGEEDFEPYVDPTATWKAEQPAEVDTLLPAIATVYQQGLTAIRKIADLPVLRNPVAHVRGQLIELECRLCGSPLLNMAYSLRESVARAQIQIVEEQQMAQEIATVERNALLLHGLSKALRFMGESMIQASDSIASITIKKVESVARQGQDLSSY